MRRFVHIPGGVVQQAEDINEMRLSELLVVRRARREQDAHPAETHDLSHRT